MRPIALTVLVVAMALASHAQLQSLVVDGNTRQYEVNVPQNFEAGMPVVISLHGWTETITFYRQFTTLHEVGDTAGFIVVYPEGIDASWNIGMEFCPFRSPFPDLDDVEFISVLIDTLYSKYNIDLTRVYCCGFSTGGDLAYRLACQLGDRIAAIAPVSGLSIDSTEYWEPVRAIPVMHIHGTDDLWNLYYGYGSIPGVSTSEEAWSVQKTLDFWIENNQCNPQGDTVNLPDLDPDDGCTVQKITFEGNGNNAPVIHYKLVDGGHSWPGSQYTIGSWEGNRNMDFIASQEIWNFFKNFQNPMAVEVSTEKPVAKIYPNPTSGMLTIELGNPVKQETSIEVLSVTGTLIFKKTYGNKNSFIAEQVDLSGCAEGIVLVRIQQDRLLYVGKVAVK